MGGDLDNLPPIDADPIAPIEVGTQGSADQFGIGLRFRSLQFVDVRQVSHAGNDAPQRQGVRTGRRVHQYRPKQALAGQKERWDTVSAGIDDTLMVVVDVVVGGLVR